MVDPDERSGLEPVADVLRVPRSQRVDRPAMGVADAGSAGSMSARSPLDAKPGQPGPVLVPAVDQHDTLGSATMSRTRASVRGSSHALRLVVEGRVQGRGVVGQHEADRDGSRTAVGRDAWRGRPAGGGEERALAIGQHADIMASSDRWPGEAPYTRDDVTSTMDAAGRCRARDPGGGAGRRTTGPGARADRLPDRVRRAPAGRHLERTAVRRYERDGPDPDDAAQHTLRDPGHHPEADAAARASGDPRLAYAEFLLRVNDDRTTVQSLNNALSTAAQAQDLPAVRKAAVAILDFVVVEYDWLREHPPAECYAAAHASARAMLDAYSTAADMFVKWADTGGGLSGLAALGDALDAAQRRVRRAR